MEITDEMLETARANNPNSEVIVVDGQIVVGGVGSMIGRAGWAGKNPVLRQALEQADVLAIESCMNEGLIGDPDAIIERKRQFRERVRDAYNMLIMNAIAEDAKRRENT